MKIYVVCRNVPGRKSQTTEKFRSFAETYPAGRQAGRQPIKWINYRVASCFAVLRELTTARLQIAQLFRHLPGVSHTHWHTDPPPPPPLPQRPHPTPSATERDDYTWLCVPRTTPARVQYHALLSRADGPVEGVTGKARRCPHTSH
jgi:hypothetical protein